MHSFPRLLCLMMLSTAALSQVSSPAFVSADPSLAREVQVAKVQPQPSQLDASSQSTLQARTNVGARTLPVATVLRLKLDRSVSTATARRGEQLTATLTAPVQLNGQTVLPAGSPVDCSVENARGSRRFAGKPSITIKVRGVRLANGEQLKMSASAVDTAVRGELDVDQEGNIRGATPNPLNKIEAGSLTGVGAVAGAVIAGPEGLFIGTATGALVAAGHIVIKHRELTLPTGTELIFELDSPVALSQTTAITAR